MPWKKPVIFNIFQPVRCPPIRRMPGDGLCGHPGPPNLHCDWNYLDPLDLGISRSEKIGVKNHGKPQYPLGTPFRGWKNWKIPHWVTIFPAINVGFPIPSIPSCRDFPATTSKRPAMTCGPQDGVVASTQIQREWWTQDAIQVVHRRLDPNGGSRDFLNWYKPIGNTKLVDDTRI